jgi:hypothetical protein
MKINKNIVMKLVDVYIKSKSRRSFGTTYYYFLSSNKKLIKEFLEFCFYDVKYDGKNFICAGIKDKDLFKKSSLFDDKVNYVDKNRYIFKHIDFSIYEITTQYKSKYPIPLLIGITIISFLILLYLFRNVYVLFAYCIILSFMIFYYFIGYISPKDVYSYLCRKLEEFEKIKKDHRFLDIYKYPNAKEDKKYLIIIESNDKEKIDEINEKLKEKGIKTAMSEIREY